MAQDILVVPSNLEAELMGGGAYDTKIYPLTHTHTSHRQLLALHLSGCHTNISQPLSMCLRRKQDST